MTQNGKCPSKYGTAFKLMGEHPLTLHQITSLFEKVDFAAIL